MSKDIVFVSNNDNKVNEIKNILKPLGFNVLSLKDLNIKIDVKEDGSTYEENALKKARALKDEFTRVMADDSGLEIFALDNQPGVYSSRFLGTKTPYDKKNQMVIEMLKAKKDKRAKFVSVIAYINNKEEKLFRGEVLGEIAEQASGKQGFGYDPIFKAKGFKETFAEISDKEKNIISHRAKALLKLKEYLTNE